MKKTLLFPFIALAVLLPAACDELSEDIGLPDELSDLKITASVTSWGTDTSLEKDDRVGLFATAPFDADNLLLTVGEARSLVSSEGLKWQLDSTVSTVTFVAYAPYSASFRGPYATFAASADQTSDAAVKASDLMMARAEVKMLTNEVNLQFAHKMVRVGLYFDNGTGKTISSVEFDNAILGTGVDLREAAVFEDSLSFRPSRVRLAPFAAKDGRSYYAAIIAPQSVMLSATVTFSDGTSSSFRLLRERSFASGQQWDNGDSPIVLSAENDKQETPSEFDIRISPWAGGDELQFSR